jgi:hypothetical protein
MAKKKAAAVPKRIGGVKIPKQLRRGRVAQVLASPVGVAILAEAIIQAGERVLGSQTRPGSAARRLAGGAKHAGEDAFTGASAGGSNLAFALGEAARSFADAVHRGGDEGRADERVWDSDRDRDRLKKSPPPKEAH